MKLAKLVDPIFKKIIAAIALSVLVIAFLLAYKISSQSMPAIQKFGFRFLITDIWDPVKENFGALPFIYGTLVTSALALLIAVPVSLGIAIFLTEYAPLWLRQPLSFLVELLAAIPSVIYGLWGIFVLVPLLREIVQPFLSKYFGFLPIFSGDFYGVSMMAAGIILSIMIIPTISSVTKEVFLAVPSIQKEAALALGATRAETINLAVLKNAKKGVLGAVILGLGRALGETMAVTMVIGNTPQISTSLFAPGHTLASVIANEFAEATGDLHLQSLMELGLILFFITLILNIIARAMVWSVKDGIKE